MLQHINLDMHIVDLYIATWKRIHKMQQQNDVVYTYL